MKLIVAVAEDWGIGYKNKLLFSIPEDMKFFRETTKDSVVIMGRRTLESFPGKKPLKNRVNIVLTSHMDYKVEGAVTCFSAKDAAMIAKSYDKELFIIGGARVYREFLPYCEKAYVTRVHSKADADSFFPNLDEKPEWVICEKSETIYDNGHEFEFCVYENQEVQKLV